MKKLFTFLAVTVLVLGCILGGATAYRFNIDPDTPMGESYSLVDNLYNLYMNTTNRLVLDARYGTDLSTEQANQLFNKKWLPDPGFTGNPVDINLPDGTVGSVKLVTEEDLAATNGTINILVHSETGQELIVVE